MLEPGGRKQGSTRRNRRVATGELPQTQLAKGRDACRALARPSPKSEEPRTPQPFAARKRLQKELPERELSGDLRPAEITPPYRPGNTLLPTSKGKNRAVIKSWGGGGTSSRRQLPNQPLASSGLSLAAHKRCEATGWGNKTASERSGEDLPAHPRSSVMRLRPRLHPEPAHGRGNGEGVAQRRHETDPRGESKVPAGCRTSPGDALRPVRETSS